jgi:hypothetical protein
MPRNPINKGMIARKASGIGAVTRSMIQKRAGELALISGRIPPLVTKADLEQAERELRGGPELDRREQAEEAIPESGRWDPVPGSKGRETPGQENEDEDDEGRNESAQLIEEGVQEADHDQRLQAEKSARRTQKKEG